MKVLSIINGVKGHMHQYEHKKIEKKWQKYWERKKLNRAKDPGPIPRNSASSLRESAIKPKFYGLIEFPYPSAEGLHVGHIRSNTAMDIIARKRRAEGYEVMYPIGWDAFGLPTENYAIKTGIHPAIVTKKNTENFRRQLKALGFSFDWSREINTTDPMYYKWTQWIFLKFFEKGLAYKKRMAINWCPSCKIGLANEEVVNGACERCGTSVEKLEKEQWMLAITKYADRLDKDLDTVDFLPQIKIQQKNWIGRSHGAEITFEIRDFSRTHADFTQTNAEKEIKVAVFTTRPDTLFGATYLVLAPEHELVKSLLSSSRKRGSSLDSSLHGNDNPIENWEEVEKYIHEASKKNEIERTTEGKEKTGVELKGIEAINPANGEEVPVWVADYILADYGTGAIMAVPAHDERDFEFAKKFGLPIHTVIEPLFIKKSGQDGVKNKSSFVERQAITAIVKHWSEDKYIGLKWKKVDWDTFITGGVEKEQTPEQAARAEIMEETGFRNPKLIKKLQPFHSKFFHVPKDENRFAHFQVFYFELENGEHEEVGAEEREKHDVVWLTREEMEKFRLPEGHRLSWEILTGRAGAYSGEGILTDSGTFTGMASAEAKNKITEFVGGKIVTTYKLRDWVFSRQRYWGEPIPLVFCEACAKKPRVRTNADLMQTNAEGERLNPGWFAVPEKDLPVKLPKVKNYQPTDTGESPLANISKWVNVKCPSCGGKAKRETDTMPNWAGSSWYYLAYAMHRKLFPKSNVNGQWSNVLLESWIPVDWYNGGMEHTTLHLLYSRFWHKFLFDLELVPTSEPYLKRTSHGLILGEGGAKMSKSVGNAVSPDVLVNQFGADTLRLYEMFMGPFDQHIAWSTESMIGPRRFLEKVWKLSQKLEIRNPKSETNSKSQIPNPKLEQLLHKTIKKVSEDIEAIRFNTAVSALMIVVNEMEKASEITLEQYKILLRLLAPFAPHISEELWQQLGAGRDIIRESQCAHPRKSAFQSIHLEPWPVYDGSLLNSETFALVVQVNGKVRANLSVEKDISENEARARVFALPEVVKWIDGKEVRKVIYVKGRIINLVV